MSWAEAVFKETDDLPLVGLDRPIELNLQHLTRPFFLAWWASDESRPALRVHLRSQDKLKVDWSPTLARVRQRGPELLVGAEKEAARFAHLKVLDRVASVLATLEAADGLELAVSGPRPLRFSGPVEQGIWKLTEVFPAVSTQVLRRALELAREATEDECLTAASEALAEAAEASLRAEWNLEEDSNPRLQRQQAKLLIREQNGEVQSWMKLFAVHVFLHDPEFRQAWGLDAFLEELLEQSRQHHQQMSGLTLQLAQVLNQSLGVTMGDRLFQGKKGCFYRSEICRGDWLQPLDIDIEDRELKDLGFTPIGDLTCDSLAGAVIRIYSCSQQDCWAVVTSGAQRQLIREFFSEYQDGSKRTTTTLPFSESKAARKLFKASYPELEWPELLKAHRDWSVQQALTPCPHGDDLAGVAGSIDRYLVLWG